MKRICNYVAPIGISTNSVVVTYKISILVPRVQFPVGALFLFVLHLIEIVIECWAFFVSLYLFLVHLLRSKHHQPLGAFGLFKSECWKRCVVQDYNTHNQKTYFQSGGDTYMGMTWVLHGPCLGAVAPSRILGHRSRPMIPPMSRSKLLKPLLTLKNFC